MAALVALVAWDQSGFFASPAVSQARPVQVAGMSYVNADGPETLGARLRVGGEPPELASTPAVDEPAAELPVAAAVPSAPTGERQIVAPPVATRRPARQAPTPPPAMLRTDPNAGVTPAGGTWAVLIGINDYPGDGYDLHSAVNDVNDMNDALAKMGVPADRRLVLRDGQASAGTIRASIDWLNAHAASDATAVFFFAGHVRKVSSTTEALLGSDGEMIEDRALASQLEGLQAGRSWIAIAGCYGGGFNEVVKPGRILTAAASADNLAYENDRFGRSYLVEYMIRRGMIGKGLTTVESAFAYAVAELKRDFPNRLPVQQDQSNGDLDLRPSGANRPTTTTPGGSPPTTPTTPPPPSDGPPESQRDCATFTGGVTLSCSGS